MLTVGTTVVLMVIAIGLLDAVVGVAQIALLVSVQVTTSPLFKELVRKVGLFVPAGTPFTNQAYTAPGPPLVATAVKVALTPEQRTLLGLTDIFTPGVTSGFTIMVMALLVSVAGTAHTALLVNTQVMTSPVISPLSV